MVETIGHANVLISSDSVVSVILYGAWEANGRFRVIRKNYQTIGNLEMLNSNLLTQALRSEASIRTLQHFARGEEFDKLVDKLVNTIVQLAKHGQVTIDGYTYKYSEYELTDNMHKFIQNGYVYLVPGDSHRTKPILETSLLEVSEGFLNPTEVLYFFADYNEEQGNRMKLSTSSNSSDLRLGLNNISNVVINGRGFKFNGETSIEEISILHGLKSEFDFTSYANQFTPFQDSEVVVWLLK